MFVMTLFRLLQKESQCSHAIFNFLGISEEGPFTVLSQAASAVDSKIYLTAEVPKYIYDQVCL